jgi:TusA-related sulfurtransferase
MTDNATVTLDTSGLPCPAPLLGAKKLVDDLQPGQTLKLISDCQGTADDLFAWAKVHRQPGAGKPASWPTARRPT